MLFDKITAAPADPILGLGEAFKAEKRPEKVNLGIGVYKDAAGKTPVLKAVKAAANKVTARVNAVLARARAKSSLKAESGRRYTEANRDDKNRIRNWTDSATIFVESRDFAALSKFAADSQKEASVQNLYFSVSPEKRAKAVEEAGDIALKSFARRAQSLSRSLGFGGYKIVRLNLRHSFNNIESADAGMRARAYAAAPALSLKAKAAADMQVQSGEEEVNQTVSATVQMQ